MTCKKECMELKKDGQLKDCPILKENEELKAEIENLKKTYKKQRNKRIDELQKEISVLLSCSNCSENKGGYICDKEYNDKCFAQKIEYIKELKEENEQLKEKLDVFQDMVADMCTTDNPVLFDYLHRILKKYEVIV